MVLFVAVVVYMVTSLIRNGRLRLYLLLVVIMQDGEFIILCAWLYYVT